MNSAVRRPWHVATVACCLTPALAAGFEAAESSRYKLDLGTELRWFPQTAVDARQRNAGLSLSLAGRADWSWAGGKTQLSLAPFARLDTADRQRSHADLREFELRHRDGNLDWRAGIGRVFWGTTESVHLVDIINQTDGVESVDGEDKLGQPLLSLAWTQPVGVFSVFVLPGFRERTLPGVTGRLRPTPPYATDGARYESSRGRQHIDAALRWSLSADDIDIGLSHFVGTAREPRFELDDSNVTPVLRPVYDQIHQTGLDFNAVSGGWIWKLEALHQRNRIDNFSAAVGGFEYTLGSSEVDAPEIGLLSELAWDSRGQSSTTAFQRDLFLGLRLSLNDVDGSEMLAGVMQDLQGAGRSISLDASRRIGDAARLVLKVRIFNDAPPSDPLAVLAQDDHLTLEYTAHF